MTSWYRLLSWWRLKHPMRRGIEWTCIAADCERLTYPRLRAPGVPFCSEHDWSDT